MLHFRITLASELWLIWKEVIPCWLRQRKLNPRPETISNWYGVKWVGCFQAAWKLCKCANGHFLLFSVQHIYFKNFPKPQILVRWRYIISLHLKYYFLMRDWPVFVSFHSWRFFKILFFINSHIIWNNEEYSIWLMLILHLMIFQYL